MPSPSLEGRCTQDVKFLKAVGAETDENSKKAGRCETVGQVAALMREHIELTEAEQARFQEEVWQVLQDRFNIIERLLGRTTEEPPATACEVPSFGASRPLHTVLEGEHDERVCERVCGSQSQVLYGPPFTDC